MKSDGDIIESSWKLRVFFSSYLCSFLASYTAVCLLDHDRWMKEWGYDHHAVPVMHLQYPLMSAAVMLGIGGIAFPHYILMTGLTFEGIDEVLYNVNMSLLSAVIAVACTGAVLVVVRLDRFANVDRVEKLKTCILELHTITALKTKKHVGRTVAYFAELKFIALGAVFLSSGTLATHFIIAFSIRGGVKVGMRAFQTVVLIAMTFTCSLAACWFLFRLLVWKASDERLRPIGACLLATSMSMALFYGDVALVYKWWGDDSSDTSSVWHRPSIGIGGRDLVLFIVEFVTILTLYAIGLELRLAYNGLQDANLDLMLANSTEVGTRRSSANTSPHRGSVGGSTPGSPEGNGGREGSVRSPAQRARLHNKRRSSMKNMQTGNRTAATVTWTTVATRAVTQDTTTSLLQKGASAFSSLGSRIGLLHQSSPPRNVRVQPTAHGEECVPEEQEEIQGVEKPVSSQSAESRREDNEASLSSSCVLKVEDVP